MLVLRGIPETIEYEEIEGEDPFTQELLAYMAKPIRNILGLVPILEDE